jgi:hypothetical protein
MYFDHPTFCPCQATSVSFHSAGVRIVHVIPCEFALMHLCLLFLFHFSYLLFLNLADFCFYFLGLTGHRQIHN